MKNCISALLKKYGEPVTVKSDSAPTGRAGFGMIEPIGENDRSMEHKHTRPGIAQPRRYLLIAPAELICDGEKNREVISARHSYTVMRAEPIRFDGETTHWECILRRKDVPEHD